MVLSKGGGGGGITAEKGQLTKKNGSDHIVDIDVSWLDLNLRR